MDTPSPEVAPVTLTREDAAALNAVRALAERLANRFGIESYSTTSVDRARVLGRLHEIASELGDRAFGLLNAAASYAGDPIADAAVHAWRDRERSREELEAELEASS